MCIRASIGVAVGFAQVRMILGDFVSDVEFVVFGKFAGFDAVLGQEWFKRYQCVLDMGTGTVTISADNRKLLSVLCIPDSSRFFE